MFPSLRYLLPMALMATLPIAAAPAEPLTYPQAPRAEVVDDYFGTPVPDPYRGLEDVDAPATREWVRAEQALTGPLLAALPDQARLRARLTTLWNYEKRSLPRFAGGLRFYLRNDGLQNQPVLMVQREGEAARVLIDPNQLSADGTTALTAWEPSPDGRRVAYTLAEAGSDWERIHIREVDRAADLPEVLARVKFSRLAWTASGDTLLYSRYPDPPQGEGGTFETLTHHAVYRHRLGTTQGDDALLFQPDEADAVADAGISDDGRFLAVQCARGASENNRLYLYDLGDAAHPRFDTTPVLLGADYRAAFQFLGNRGDTLYLLTSSGAPNRRVIALQLRQPEQWQPIIPEASTVLTDAVLAGDALLAHHLRDASSRLSRVALDGRPLGGVRLPGLGDASGLSGKAGQREAYIAFSSFNTPMQILRLDMRSGRLHRDWAPTLAFDPADYRTEQVFYRSRDGTRVPMFISYRKGLRKNGRNPTLLYGYGGFSISLLPSFSVQNLAWMEQGGVYAQPSLRGGGEYGQDWHLAGTQGRKQNVFDDFAAAAHYLIDHGYTTPAHLGIYGRSNGGLLVGATLNQHPELFAAAVPGVGVMDMLRFHRFTIGAAWREDYGSSETPAGFRWLYAYSPLHNIRPGVAYPPTLTLTADHDDRVVPGHSYKYAATLQWANAGNPNPQLIRIEQQGGHGAGKPVAKKIDEVADVLAFLTRYTR